jgi:hypothetical protein
MEREPRRFTLYVCPECGTYMADPYAPSGFYCDVDHPERLAEKVEAVEVVPAPTATEGSNDA